MKPIVLHIILICCCLFNRGQLFAQGYFKWLEQPAKSYHKKIDRFRNGDVLIGDSSAEGINSDQNRGVFLSRIDPCGNIVWTRNYQWKQNYMEFKDLKISDTDDIFVYGSTYEMFDEYVFLLKLSTEGAIRKFRLFQGGTIDHFSYNIDLAGDRLLAYGLLLDWNSQKQGFVAIFDLSLNYLWGTRYAPFESVGQAVFTEDNGLLCLAGPYLVKFDAQGQQQWAVSQSTGSGAYPFAGPLEVSGGYVLGFYQAGFCFFYKINYQGQLVWKSDKFPSSNTGADLQALENKQILASYNRPGTGENFLCQLLLSSEGQISQQKELVLGEQLFLATSFQSVGEDNVVSIIGNPDPANSHIMESGFLVQFPLDSLSGKCFNWALFNDHSANDIPLEINVQTLDFFDFNIDTFEGSISSGHPDYSFREICDIAIPHYIYTDTLLGCGLRWALSLPDHNFRWKDGAPSAPRSVSLPGIYEAANNNCLDPIIYSFELQKEPCDCPVYLPNAFSPNADGLNDQLRLFSQCTLQSLTTSIYNRWGAKIFQGTTANDFWDGNVKGKAAQPGIYIVVVHYQLLDETGILHDGSLVQEVMVAR